MVSRWKTVATFGAIALLFGSAAHAADVGRYPSGAPLPPLLQSAPLLVDEFSSGWYLRGDVGYRMNDADNVSNSGAPPRLRNTDIDNSWLLGGGVGYKWEWFRTDITADYGTRTKFTGDSRAATGDFTAHIDTVTGLWNVYGDLGTWFGFTPYIGAGAGFARLKASDFNVASVGGTLSGSETSYNFAWAYMAGVSYKVMGNFHVDLSYRHVEMGDAITNRDVGRDRLRFDKVSADEVRLGFRYTLD